MSKKESDLGIDLITPIAEILQELIKLTLKGIGALMKFAFNKAFNKNPSVEKIDRDSLKVKKTTDIEAFLGVDTKTKRGFPNLDIDFRRHSFIVGASGFGKTNLISLLQEHTLKCDKPIIFFDPKGDLEALTSFKHLSEKWGRDCFVFSEHYKDSIALNPLKEGTVNQVCNRIMNAFEWSNAFYRDCCEEALTHALKKIRKSGHNFTIRKILEHLRSVEDENIKGIITKLEAIDSSDFGDILSRDDAHTFSEIRDKGVCLYIGLSTQGYPGTARAIGKLFLGELMYNSYASLRDNANKEALKNPLGVFFDEFGALVTPEFIELQNKCRGAGIELTMAVQTASDINRVDPELTSQVIENAGNIFILKQRLDTSASYFANSIGTTLSKKYTYSIEEDERTSAGSEREVHEHLVHPDIIKNLRIGQCIFLSQSPTRLKLINLRNAETSLNSNFCCAAFSKSSEEKQNKKQGELNGDDQKRQSSVPLTTEKVETDGLKNTEGRGKLPRLGGRL